eukprot:TRINITY_DN4471_c0_g1_i1.p2 TRINITY_DN4471_c0_g1~~TRINITY_DN4471_c0_g1_i1.p2  ORF type:complete len:525 (-),score=56.06 TRINITY_DN4471_c0_g1_i1:975-2549(-)
MDSLQNRSNHLQLPSKTPSLICVGGMLRVADTPPPQTFFQSPPGPDAATSTSDSDVHNATTPFCTPNITPFKSLVSPFAAAVPFTAPTTPYSPSTKTPVPLQLSLTQTPSNVRENGSMLSSFKLPTAPTNRNRTKTFQKEAQASAHHLLTPKQVRELRRLCRKTANRAEFEDRLIQIRQVASIAAMASSSLHLFDPQNPQSGLPLRIWVETHRADGADWRDERPLSDSAIRELRRWDRLLKAWSRVRFETIHTMESDGDRNILAGSGSESRETVLQPVRLRFEQIPVGTSPVTPLNHLKDRRAGDAKTTSNIGQITSPTTPNEQHVSFLRSLRTVERKVLANLGASEITGSAHGSIGNSNVLRMGQSEWTKVLPSAVKNCIDGRKPFGEISINKVGDLINVTVPTNNARQVASNHSQGFGTTSSSGLDVPMAKYVESALGFEGMKSWRSVALESVRCSSQDVNESTGFKSLTNYDEREYKCEGDGGASVDSFIPSSRSDLDWSRLRGGEGTAPGSHSQKTKPHA